MKDPTYLKLNVCSPSGETICECNYSKRAIGDLGLVIFIYGV
jgi:hypothetical protein